MIHIDLQGGTVRTDGAEGESTLAIGSPEAFKLISTAWLRSGWDAKYVYGFSWMGRPVIQLPEDMLRIQELIYRVAPDVLIETGIAHGGSLIFYASLFKAMGKGRVVGVDVEIRAHNRSAIEAHEMAGGIAMIEGSSIDPQVVGQVRSHLHAGERGMVVLDSNHTRAHVLGELRAYADFVAVGSYIVATDGLMQDLADAPGGAPGWERDNPARAARDFAAAHPEFVLEEPPFVFNETQTNVQTTHWPDAWLRRVK